MSESTRKDNISFFIPAWNCENMIGEALNSIIKTNFQEGDEIVITDDCSTDNTVSVIQKFQEKYDFIKLLHHKENKGCASSRNTAIKVCKNEILFCLDADNILTPNSIQKLKKFMLKNKADAACFGRLDYFKDFNPKKVTHKWLFRSGIHNLSDALSGPITPIASGNYMLKKTSWEKAGGYMELTRLLDTWTFGIRQLATGTKMVIMPNSSYLHRCGYESNYVHYSKKGIDASALRYNALQPFFNLIEEKDVEYIKDNKDTWHSILDAHPIKIINRPYGKSGKILRKTNLYKTIKKNLREIPLLRIIYQKTKKSLKKIKTKFQVKKEFLEFKRISNKKRFEVNWNKKNLWLEDKIIQTNFDAHYIYHPAWAARILAKTRPEKHIDISSTLNFCTMLSAFIPTEFYDFRPAQLNLNNLISKKADLTSLEFNDSSINSLSCMHTVEHIGLGRYGDKIDPDGDLKAIEELKRVLAKDGNLLFVVPIGQPKIMFNAHRIYSFDQVMEYFNDLQLKDFSLVTDTGKFIQNSNRETANEQKYSCGCFWFKKTIKNI